MNKTNTYRTLNLKDYSDIKIAMRVIGRHLKFDGSESKRDKFYARKIYIYYLCNFNKELSLMSIAKLMGVSTHSGVIHHRNDMSNIITVDNNFKKFVDTIMVDVKLILKNR